MEKALTVLLTKCYNSKKLDGLKSKRWSLKTTHFLFQQKVTINYTSHLNLFNKFTSSLEQSRAVKRTPEPAATDAAAATKRTDLKTTPARSPKIVAPKKPTKASKPSKAAVKCVKVPVPVPVGPALVVGPKLRSCSSLDPVVHDESKTIAALRAEIEALKTAAVRTSTPAITMDPSPTSDATPVANYSSVYRARSAAQVNLARNAAAGRTVLDNPDAEVPQYRTIIVDGAGGNYGVNLSDTHIWLKTQTKRETLCSTCLLDIPMQAWIGA